MNIPEKHHDKIMDALRICFLIADDAATSEQRPRVDEIGAIIAEVEGEMKKEDMDKLLQEAMNGLDRWTHGYAKGTDKEVCGCCGHHFCLLSCECSNLITRIARRIR
jgi:hypothetical protein